MSKIVLTPEQIRWQRFRRTGLVEPFADAPTAASALMGIQAQILPAAGLALWNRTPSFTQKDLDSLLMQQRTLVKLWGQRGTLHLYASNDWPLLHAARTVNSSWWARNVAYEAAQNAAQGAQDDEQPGAGQEPPPTELPPHQQLVEQVAVILRNQESMGRSDLRASGLPLDDSSLSPWGGIFSELVRQGYACHYGRADGEGRFVARERWLPDLVWELPEPMAANVTLLQRYLAAFGPATLHDFSYWRGIPMGIARQWFEELMPQLSEVEVDGQAAYLPASDIDDALAPPPAPEAWPVRMLYRFDLYLLGHRSKDWVVPPDNYKAVFRPAGHIEGIVVARGQALATWRYDRKGSGLIITVNPFKPLPKYVLKQVERRAKQVAAFFALPLNELIVN